MKAIRLNAGTIFRLLKKTVMEWLDDNAMRLSAALSYYSVFSIAPLLLIAIGIAGAIFGQQAAEGQIADELSKFIGWEAGQAVQTIVKSASKASNGATLTGFILLLVGASTVFGQLKDSLNSIWHVRLRTGLGIKGFIKERLMSFGMVLVIGFLLLVSLVLTTALAAMNGWMEVHFGLPKAVSGILGFIVPLGVETVLFAMIFKIMPEARIGWRSVWLGSGVTALLFEIGKAFLAWYLSQGSTTGSFGAAGSVVVLLLWVYYASCILFFGAEFTKVYAAETGCDIQPTAIAEIATANECSVPGPTRVGLRPNPLTPNAPVPAVPMKESLAPLLVSPDIEADVLRATRLPVPIRKQPKRQLQQWLEAANAHPMAELGAALGIGLLAGLLERFLERRAPELSATDHFREGSRKAVEEGESRIGRLAGWLSKNVNRDKLEEYGADAQERSSEFVHALAGSVSKALR